MKKTGAFYFILFTGAIKMAICRVQKNKNYTTVANYCLRDKNLSLKAKGLLCLVLSLPEVWDYSIRGLVSLVKEEERAVKSTLKELKDAGYLQVTKTAPRTGLNFFTYEYTFFEKPQKEILQPETVQSVGVQSVGVQNSPVYKYKEEQSKEVVSKEELLTADKAAEPEQENKPKPKKLNKLQEFSNAVIDQFENLENKDQIAVWFKRNCRCLTDILRFCGGDIQTAVETIRVCVERLEKAGLTGGYEAVCRNLPEYYQAAKKRLNGGAYAK